VQGVGTYTINDLTVTGIAVDPANPNVVVVTPGRIAVESIHTLTITVSWV